MSDPTRTTAGTWSGAFRSLNSYNYRVWAIGALISNVGAWMQRIAQDWLVLTELTRNNATAVGIVVSLQFGPHLLLLPLTGYAADHFDRRKIVIATQASLGLLALGLGLITVLGVVLVHAWPQNWVVYLGVLCLVSIFFSSLGIIFGLMAEKFDHLAVLTTFIITPLTFVGGVFTAATMLPPVMQRLELFNPIFYTIDAFRYSYTGASYLSLPTSLGAITLLTVVAFGIALRMTAVGHKLRT